MTADAQHPARLFPELAAALRGQYELERELGRGGMGIVFLAHDLKLRRRVAIKTLLPHLVTDERIRERFIREARTAAALSHPGIVPIHRADEVDGQVFFVMGLVEGESVAELVRDRGPLPPTELVRYLRDVAAALGAAHDQGVTHRDVKAENILIERRSRRAVVTDFGIARLAEAAPLTATGLVLGTVYYMSPEQVSGEPGDARSDIYSLGVVAFHALSGRFPFESEIASAVLVAHVTKPAPRMASIAPDVPAGLANLVDRCLAKDPAGRYPSCGALDHALAGLSEELAAAARLAPIADTAKKRSGVLVSETEAQAVWERAAELQARPDAPSKRVGADAHRTPASLSSAYPLDVVRDSAREAGIATGYVDRALVEHGLAQTAGSAGVPARAGPAAVVGLPAVRDRCIDERSPWTGAKPNIDYELVIDDEMRERDFDWLIETIRRALGDVGTVSTVGRTLSWVSTDPQRKVHITVQLRGGRTTVRVGERLAALRSSVFGGVMGGIGGGGGVGLGGLVAGVTHFPPLALVTATLIFTTSAVAARIIYGRTVRDRQRSLQALTQQLGEEVKASIAERERTGGDPRIERPGTTRG